jgi:hypothetical protein
MTFVKSFFLIAGSIIMANSSFSQGKELTEKQMLRGEKTNITTSLPQVLGWTDDAHFLISSKVNPDSPYKVFLVDCKTGKQTPSSVDILKKEPLASITVSVRNNDLFLNEIEKDELLMQEESAPIRYELGKTPNRTIWSKIS